MAEKPEIGATFTVSDAATQVLDKIKSGFKSASDSADKVAASFIDIGKTALGTALGLNIGSLTSSMNELGKAALQRAIDFQNAEKNAVLLSASVAKAGMSFDKLKEHANGFVQDMKRIETQTGITSATLNDSFAQIADKFNPARAYITQAGNSVLMPLNWIEKGLQRSDKQIKQIFVDIGNAGKLVPGGADALAKSFAGFSASGAKASDPIVQMIAATGTLKGNAQQVAAQLRLLTDASALSFAQAAIEKMAKKGQYLAPDFQTTVNQLVALRDNFVTQFGQPILKGVVPVMERFRTMVEVNADKIEKFTKVMGEKVVKIVDSTGKAIENGFKYVVNHADEIAKAIEKGTDTARRVFEFILSHKEEIAVAFGLKAVAPTVVGAGKAILPGMVGLAQSGGLGLAAGSTVAGMGSLAAGAAVLTAFVAAVGAATAALYQMNALIKENYYKGRFGEGAEKEKSQDARKEAFKQIAHGADYNPEQLEAVKKRFIDTEKELGRSGKGAEEYVNSLVEQGKAYQTLKTHADMAKAFIEGGSGAKLRVGSSAPTQVDAANDKQAETIVNMYNLAVTQNNKQMAAYAANIIASSTAVQNAFVNSKATLTNGFEGLTEVLGDKGAELAAKLKGLQLEASGKGATPTKPVVQFNNNTFNLNQNFRDQDPDKVAIIFRQDILKQAENRRQSRVGGAFGL